MQENKISRRNFLRVAGASATAAAMGGLVPAASAAGIKDLWSMDLQILATSDTHGKFDPWDYAANKADASGSVAQQATAIKENRTKTTLVVDAGDTIQANSAELFLNDDVHPMIAAQNAIGYDVYVTGNHEYNYGMATLEKVLSQQKAKVLTGNVYSPEGKPLADGYTIINKGGVKIGVIGMVTPNITRWDAKNLEGWTVTNPVDESRKIIDKIKNDVDVIIASYEGRKHGPIRRLGTKVSVWATSKMLGKDPNLQITSFRLIRRFLVEAMLQTNTYLPQIGNLLVLSSNRIINVPVHHDARAYGKSGYSFRRLVRDLLYDITSHSAFPLLLVRDLGICSFLVSVALGIFFLIRYFLYGISVEGWTSLMLVLLAFFGITLLSIGIMGIYLMNILNESKKMPHYVIRRKDV